MIKKFALALSVTTICSPIHPTYAFQNNDFPEIDRARRITVKKTAIKNTRIERLVERKKVLNSRMARVKKLIERRKLTRLAKISRAKRIEEHKSIKIAKAQRLAERRKATRLAKISRTKRIVELRNIRIARNNRARFENLLKRPSFKKLIASMKAEITKNVLLQVRKEFTVTLSRLQGLRPVEQQVRRSIDVPAPHYIERTQPLVAVQNLPTRKVAMNEPYLTSHLAPVAFQEMNSPRQVFQTSRGLKETQHETSGMTPILEKVGAGIQYVKDMLTPKPTDEDAPVDEEGSAPLLHSLKPRETKISFDDQSIAFPVKPFGQGTWGTWSSAEEDDSSEGFPFSKKFKGNQAGYQPQSPFTSPSSHRVLFQGRDVGGSPGDEGNNLERKPKVPQLSLSSPNPVRFGGILIESGSSSVEDFLSPPSTGVKRRENKLYTVQEEGEDELTFAGLPGKLETLVNLGTMLKFPDDPLQSKNAANSFSKLRAKLEGLDEKALVVGDIGSELPLLQKSIKDHTSKVQQDESSFPKVSPRTVNLRRGLIRSVDLWLGQLLRINEESIEK